MTRKLSLEKRDQLSLSFLLVQRILNRTIPAGGVLWLSEPVKIASRSPDGAFAPKWNNAAGFLESRSSLTHHDPEAEVGAPRIWFAQKAKGGLQHDLDAKIPGPAPQNF